MISVSLFTKQNTVTGIRCEGHSGYEERGKDIVCAAVSVLIINAINSLEELTDTVPEVFVDEKKAVIDFRVKELTHDASLLIASACIGLRGVEEEYGKRFINISMKEV